MPSIHDVGIEKVSVTVGTSGSCGSSIISGDTISAEFISAELKSPNSDDSGLSDEIMSGDTKGADGGHGRGECNGAGAAAPSAKMLGVAGARCPPGTGAHAGVPGARPGVPGSMGVIGIIKSPPGTGTNPGVPGALPPGVKG